MSAPQSMAVVMPVRNYAAAAMKRCIESLRRQEADPSKLDILVADYGSSPKEAAAVKELAAATGARYVWFDEKGPWNRSRAINLGVRATTAPIVVTSDADLVFAQNFTATVMALAEKYAGGEVYAFAPMMDLPENLTIDLTDYEADYARLLKTAKERIWSRGNVIFSRTLFERIRGWEEAYEIWGCEDNDFSDRAKRSGAAVVDLKGVTSYLHHWHISNKRGAEAAAQVARNQIMCWPVEGRAPARRTGPMAGDPALAEHKTFQLPSVAIFITGANDIAKADVTRASIAAQTYRDVKVIPVFDAAAVSAALQQATEHVVGVMQAGEVFLADDALTWRVLIPLLKGETPQMSFMWRKPSQYTASRQIVAAGSAPIAGPAAAPAKKPLFGNYGATVTHSMSEPVKAAMLFSRAPIRNEQDLADAVAAEKTLSEMNDADFEALKAQRAENSDDPYFYFWAGLVHLQRREPIRAKNGFTAALQGGLNHPRVAKAAALADAMLAAKQTQRAPVGTLSRAEAARRLTPHFVKLTPLPDQVPVVRMAPQLLLNARRFDLALKYLYASYRRQDIQTDFAKRAYLAHIGVFNGFNEGDGSKSGPEAFVANFNQIIKSVAASGFDDKTSAVPIDRNGAPMDGAHRVAACLACNVPVTCLELPADGAVYDYAYFRDRTKFVAGGLDAHYADAAALAYAKLKTNTHIVNLFPAALGHDAEVEAILKRYARIVYAKPVSISRAGVPLLMRHIYENESWLGDWSNNFRGAQNKGGRCFDGDGPVRVYLIETDAPEKLRACKEEIRALYQIGAAKNGQDAVHINDTHAETVLMAKIYFNANSIAFLNDAKPQAFEAFDQQFARYRQVLKGSGLDTDHFCIEGSATMAVYGIRASRDLDYLSLGDVAPDFGTKLIGNHASELKHHVRGRDEIIFDPANHFYFFGLKVATLDVLRGMKAKRAEKPKDFNDIALIDGWQRSDIPVGKPLMENATSSQFSQANIEALEKWAGTQFAPPAPKFVKFGVLGRNGLTDATWIETGTYMGDTTEWLRQRVRSVYSIEPEPTLFQKAKERFAAVDNVTIINALSETALPDLLPKLSGDVCFWLDGHYSAGVTHKGPLDTPIKEELICVAKNLHRFGKVVVMVDDIRMFNGRRHAYGNYPTLDEVVDWARAARLTWHIEQDILIARNF